jgi:pyruvate formate lyase activating enzyme
MMNIGGLLKFSLIDYPGKMSAVVFTQGCNFRCPYCHNSELVKPESFCEPIPERTVLDFLKTRVGQLQGVVVTGGEPTLQEDLADFLFQVKEMGYLVKLDTNGSRPEVLKEIFERRLVDYVAMDIKAPLEKYSQLTSLKNCAQRIRESIRLILASGLTHEFRTTLGPPIVPGEDLPKMAALVKGAKKYRLQRFVPRDNILIREVCDDPLANLSDEEVAKFQDLWGIGGN